MNEITDEEYEKLDFWERVKYEWKYSGVFENIYRFFQQIGKKEVKKDDRIQVSGDKEVGGSDSGTGQTNKL